VSVEDEGRVHTDIDFALLLVLRRPGFKLSVVCVAGSLGVLVLQPIGSLIVGVVDAPLLLNLSTFSGLELVFLSTLLSTFLLALLFRFFTRADSLIRQQG
jgi:hypothetical protein